LEEIVSVKNPEL
jgi:GTPase